MGMESMGSAASAKQLIYCMQRMLEPIKEHVDNNFTPVPMYVCTEYQMIKIRIVELMRDTETQISTGRFDRYRDTLVLPPSVGNTLSITIIIAYVATP